MALYMLFHVIPDSHIDFLSDHPETFRPYMEGRKPQLRKSWLDAILGRDVALELPEDWPENELEGFCPEVNHRQVEYFHYLLNGTKDKVHHSGCIFQTWFAPGHQSVAVTIDGENFALRSELVRSLKDKIQNLGDNDIFDRYRDAVDDVDLDEADKEFLLNAFGEISAACDSALEAGEGLMWTAG